MAGSVASSWCQLLPPVSPETDAGTKKKEDSRKNRFFGTRQCSPSASIAVSESMRGRVDYWQKETDFRGHMKFLRKERTEKHCWDDCRSKPRFGSCTGAFCFNEELASLGGGDAGINSNDNNLLADARPRALQRRSCLLGLTLLEGLRQSSILGIPDTAYAAEEEVERKKALNVKAWKRYFGQGFDFRVPPGFIDITAETAPAEGSATGFTERSPTNPFLARFASPDRSAILSVVLRQANSLKLSFFEAKDMSDFGSVEEAAAILVPAGAKILVSGAIPVLEARPSRLCVAADENCNITSTRNYYLYEFYTRGRHVAMAAAANGGLVYVFGAMAPQAKWSEDPAPLLAAVRSFSLS